MSKKVLLFVLCSLVGLEIKAMFVGSDLTDGITEVAADFIRQAANKIKKAKAVALRTKALLVENGLDFDHGEPPRLAELDEAKLQDMLMSAQNKLLAAARTIESGRWDFQKIEKACQEVGQYDLENIFIFCKKVIHAKLPLSRDNLNAVLREDHDSKILNPALEAILGRLPKGLRIPFELSEAMSSLGRASLCSRKT